jgi:hypothetical protein
MDENEDGEQNYDACEMQGKAEYVQEEVRVGNFHDFVCSLQVAILGSGRCVGIISRVINKTERPFRAEHCARDEMRAVGIIFRLICCIYVIRIMS